MEWPDAVKSIYNFRQALLVNDGKVVEDGSVLDAISGDYSDTEANNVTVKSNGAHFNGIYVTGKFQICDQQSKCDCQR